MAPIAVACPGRRLDVFFAHLPVATGTRKAIVFARAAALGIEVRHVREPGLLSLTSGKQSRETAQHEEQGER
jgi:hypothetical protein